MYARTMAACRNQTASKRGWHKAQRDYAESVIVNKRRCRSNQKGILFRFVKCQRFVLRFVVVGQSVATPLTPGFHTRPGDWCRAGIPRPWGLIAVADDAAEKEYDRAEVSCCRAELDSRKHYLSPKNVR